MDYKEKYNKLVEAIKVLQETNPSDEGIQNWVNDSVPELKESENEKVRKAIIELVKQSSEVLDKQNQNDMIAWLEKQEGCEYIKKDWLEHIKQSWYKEGFIDGKYNGGTSKEWTINDAATLKELIDFLENGTAKLQHDLTRYANWLKNQFIPIEKQGEQKPAWSEEDETILTNIIIMLETGVNNYFIKDNMPKVIIWLKSIKQRIGE